MIPGKVSVVLAVFNGEAFIQKAIESVLNQVYQNLELIIINDGSTDKTAEIIGQYKDHRVRIVTNDENLKLIASLNKGLQIAQGEFIARLDADDICHKDRFAIQVGFLKENPNIGLVASGYKMFDAKGRERVKSESLDADVVKQVLRFVNPIRHSSVMFRKNLILDELQAYDKNFKHAEDYELWIRLSKKTDLRVIPDVLVNCLVHGDSVSEQFAQGMRSSFIKAKRFHSSFLFPCLSDTESEFISRIPYELNDMTISELQILDNAMQKLVSAGLANLKQGSYNKYAIRMRRGGAFRLLHNFRYFHFKPSALNRLKGDIAMIFGKKMKQVQVSEAWFN
jgi:glycosyltransferase involved in cell wall biosynthesis